MAGESEGRTGPRKDDVPDIVGQTKGTGSGESDNTITSAGFAVGTPTAEAINDSGGSIGTSNLNKVKSQVVAAGTVYPIGHAIDYTYYSPYFPPHFPPHFPPFFPPHFPPHFPPFFPLHFPPHFPPFFPPHFPPHFPPFFPPHFPPFFPPFFPPSFK